MYMYLFDLRILPLSDETARLYGGYGIWTLSHTFLLYVLSGPRVIILRALRRVHKGVLVARENPTQSASATRSHPCASKRPREASLPSTM